MSQGKGKQCEKPLADIHRSFGKKMSEETVTKACQLFLPGKQPDQCVLESLDAKLCTLLKSKSVADAMSIANIGPYHMARNIFIL